MTRLCCEQVQRSIDACVDAEMEPSDILEVQDHLAHCEECSARVSFSRASKASVCAAVRSSKASDEFRMRVASAIAEARIHSGGAPSLRQTETTANMLSWWIVGPLAAAACLALVLASASNRAQKSIAVHDAQPTASTASSASMVPIDTFLEELIDQHAHPFTPDATNPADVAGLDRFVGVPVHGLRLSQVPDRGVLLGGRVVPIRQQRAAMMQYMLGNGHRLSMYVYNPGRIRTMATPRLREQVVGAAVPVYLGSVRGYSVALTDKRGVGYALASDLDEQESGRIIAAVGESP